MLRGKDDSRLLGIAAIKRRHVANASHELAARAAGERVQRLIPGVAFHAGDAHLDELVIVQRSRSLGDDGIACACLADENDGLERMAEAAQVPALFVAELQVEIPGGKGGNGSIYNQRSDED